jgi:hypothetical protein
VELFEQFKHMACLTASTGVGNAARALPYFGLGIEFEFEFKSILKSVKDLI